MAHKRVSQLGMATFLSTLYLCMAHKRVSQVGVTTSFSKFYPAPKRVSQVEMATSFSKFYPPEGHQRVLKILPCPQKGESS